MAHILDRQIYTCALGAVTTVRAIEGAIPVLHSGPGCAGKVGGGGSGHYSPNIFPCTSVSEKEVVFGGEGKLRDTIANALKVVDAELFVAVSGCTAEIVGDDIASVVQPFQDEGKPVVYANTPGFKGNNYEGHDWVLSAIFDQFVEPAETVAGRVNLFAGVPYQDPYWHGNLRTLEGLLRELGLEVNTIFGHGRGVEAVKRVSSAEFNILVSPWYGIESVKLLERKFGTPYLHWPTLPIGAYETSKWLRAVGEFTGVSAERVERVIEAHESEYFYFLERFADTFLEARAIGNRFSLVSDAQYALAVTKFLTNDMGMFPVKQFVVDNTPAKYRERLVKEFEDLRYGIKAEVEFTTNGFSVQQQLREQPFSGAPVVLGSSWEKKTADELGAIYLNISSPIIGQMIINSTRAGYDGGLHLVEDLYTATAQKLIL